MSFLLTPPQQNITIVVDGALRCTFPRYWIVYKSAEGVWTAGAVVSEDVLVAAEVMLPGGQGRPATVDDDLGAEIVAALPALNAALPDGMIPATCVAL